MDNLQRNEHKLDSYNIRPEAKDFPVMCVISFSYACNSQCPNCPYTNSAIREKYADRMFMNEETFRIIADQCGSHCGWIRISGGGEPMLHPHAVELMEYAKKAGAKIGLITNGSKFTRENSLRLLKAQVDMIEFSVDAADPQIYGEVRKGLNWDVLVKNVKEMVSMRNELGSTTRIIASVINQKGVDIDKVELYWKSIVDNVQKRKYLTWGINDPSYSADPTPYLPPAERIPCPFLFERLNIDSYGNVMVCGFDIASRTHLGNVHKHSITEIWKGTSFEQYRKKHLEHKGDEIELCKNCTDWKYRSWKHNYWKVVKEAEAGRDSKHKSLGKYDSEGSVGE